MADVLVATRDQIPIGEGRTFLIEGKKIAIFQTHAGELYATQPSCPHLGGPLADGLIGGTTLMCPLHDRTFDLETGRGLSHEHLCIETYATRVEPDGSIWLSLKPSEKHVEAAVSAPV